MAAEELCARWHAISVSPYGLSYVTGQPTVSSTRVSRSIPILGGVLKIKRQCGRHLGSSCVSNWSLRTAFTELHFNILLLHFIEKSRHGKPVSALVAWKQLRAWATASPSALFKFSCEKRGALSSRLLFFKNKNYVSDSISFFTLMAKNLGALHNI